MTKDDLLTIQEEVILPILNYSEFGEEPKPNTAWYVGGAVRDMMLGRQFNDIDLVARDKEAFLYNTRKFLFTIKAEFSIRDMANGHATILHIDSIGACKNIFLYPIDIEVSQLKGSLVDDALSRDFTCNAWYMKVGELTPFTPLVGDFEKGNTSQFDDMYLTPCAGIRTFEDNMLRVFRAADLIARGWKPSFELYDAAGDACRGFYNHTIIQDEKVRDGLRLAALGVVDKIITNMIRYRYEANNVVDALIFLTKVGGWYLIHKDIQKMVFTTQKSNYHNDNVWQHTLGAFKHTAYDRTKNIGYTDAEMRVILWAILLHDVGKPFTRTETGGKTHFYGHDGYGAALISNEIFRGFDNDLTEEVCRLVAHHMDTKIIGNDIVKPKYRKVIRKLLRDLGSERRFMMWVALATADEFSSKGRDTSNTAFVLTTYHQIKYSGEPDWFNYRVPVTGAELREELSIPQEESYMIGEYLNQLMKVTFSRPSDYTTKEQCIHYCRCIGKSWINNVRKHHKNS